MIELFSIKTRIKKSKKANKRLRKIDGVMFKVKQSFKTLSIPKGLQPQLISGGSGGQTRRMVVAKKPKITKENLFKMNFNELKTEKVSL